MAKVVKFPGNNESTSNYSNSSITFEGFANSLGSYSNVELMPAYLVTFITSGNEFDGKITKITKLDKKDSYMSGLNDSACRLNSIEGDKVRFISAQLDTDIEEIEDGQQLIMVFREELEDWVFNALREDNLFLSVM